MKTKLLRKLRNRGRNKITINSITTVGNTTTGMKYSYNENEYSGLFDYGDTEQDVKEKACRRYLETNIEQIRKQYKKYSCNLAKK